MLKRGQREGMLEEGLQDYVNHWWDVASKGGALGQPLAPQLTQFFANAMKRKFPSNFAGEQAGMRPVSYDISEVMGKYLDSFNRASNGRAFIKELTRSNASDGRPLAYPTGTWTQAVIRRWTSAGPSSSSRTRRASIPRTTTRTSATRR